MKVVDTRSGEELALGQKVSYPDGESVTLLEVEPGVLRARARVRHVYREHVHQRLEVREDWVPLTVRWTHPQFFLQHVAFLPS